MNRYEQEARDRKAGRLAASFYERARDACFRVDEATGVKPRPATACAGDILAMAAEAEPRHWFALARRMEIKPPTATTMALARDKVIERAKRDRERTA